ncbi:MAG: D-aminoacyl-tRNA deacylase [Thermoplasmata archaeon]|nr:D-aminoacyl-tRNA deacylase [Thermoplasmata archaeon]
MNMRQHMLGWEGWEEAGELWGSPLLMRNGTEYLALMSDEHIYHEEPDVEAAKAMPSPSLLIFLSRHRSESGARSLTVHPLGNYGENRFGGRAKALVPSAPGEMAAALRALAGTGAGLGYNITYEVTHHGPHIATPTFFIEIGSGEKEWKDREAGKAIVEALSSRDVDPGDRILVGIGGGHYAPRFTDIALHKRAAFGHMVPSYALEGLDQDGVEAALRLAMDATPGVEGFYLHKKGLKGEAKRHARAAVESLGSSMVGSGELEER